MIWQSKTATELANKQQYCPFSCRYGNNDGPGSISELNSELSSKYVARDFHSSAIEFSNTISDWELDWKFLNQSSLPVLLKC